MRAVVAVLAMLMALGKGSSTEVLGEADTDAGAAVMASVTVMADTDAGAAVMASAAVMADTDAGTAEMSEPETDRWLETIMEQLDFGELDSFALEGFPERVTFTGLVETFMEQGLRGLDGRMLFNWLWDLFFYELRASKDYFLQMLVLTAVFAVVRYMMENRGSYSSSIGHLMIYVTMMAFLMKSFLLVADLAQEGISALTRYLSLLVPAYAMTLMASGNAAGAAAYYEFSFFLMTLLGWAMRIVFVPGIHVYLLLRLFDQLYEEERLSRLAELIESAVRHGMRIGIAAALGISCVQGMLGSAQDRLNTSVILDSMSAVPGLGSLLGSSGNVLLSCGVLIRNSVGVAAAVILLLVCLIPIVKVFLFVFLYRLLAAVLQPVADRRLIQGIYSTSEACKLYLLLLQDSMIMFLITVAVITAYGSLGV